MTWLTKKLSRGFENILDTFTGNDGDDLTLHTMDSGGLNWVKTDPTSAYQIQNNRCRKVTAGTFAVNYAPLIVNSGISDGVISLDFIISTGGAKGVVFRSAGGTGQFYICLINGNNIELYRWTGSSYSAMLGSATCGTLVIGNSYKMIVTLIGTSVKITLALGTINYTDNILNNNVWHGIAAFNTQPSGTQMCDNFEITG